MRFLNIYPKRLWATLNPVGAFEGQFTFDLEQYGLMNSDIVSDVIIYENAVMPGEWKIDIKPLLDVEMPHFDNFADTLNHYVFNVLQYMPSRSASGKDLPMVKLFFDGIYFDMSGEIAVVQKIVDTSTVKK